MNTPETLTPDATDKEIDFVVAMNREPLAVSRINLLRTHVASETAALTAQIALMRAALLDSHRDFRALSKVDQSAHWDAMVDACGKALAATPESASAELAELRRQLFDLRIQNADLYTSLQLADRCLGALDKFNEASRAAVAHTISATERQIIRAPLAAMQQEAKS